MSEPFISVIVATWNAAKTVRQCIDSVAGQTLAEMELLVADGASTDGTVDILRENAGKFAWWISEPDRGVYSAWNKALPHARGEWICFLGADDWLWDARALERMAAGLRGLPPEIRVAYGQVVPIDPAGREKAPLGAPWEEAKRGFPDVMTVPHPGMMQRRSLFVERGRFDESFRIAGDYELLLRELKHGEARFIPGVRVVAMREGGLSSNPKQTIRMLEETLRAQAMHGRTTVNRPLRRALRRARLRALLGRLLGEERARALAGWLRGKTGG